jgi:hypothetical protein
MIVKNLISRSPLIKACFLNRPEVVEWLLQFEETRKYINVGDLRKRAAIHAACWGPKGGRDGKRAGDLVLSDSPESLKLLLEYGADVI